MPFDVLVIATYHVTLAFDFSNFQYTFWLSSFFYHTHAFFVLQSGARWHGSRFIQVHRGLNILAVFHMSMGCIWPILEHQYSSSTGQEESVIWIGHLNWSYELDHELFQQHGCLIAFRLCVYFDTMFFCWFHVFWVMLWFCEHSYLELISCAHVRLPLSIHRKFSIGFHTYCFILYTYILHTYPNAFQKS